MENVILKVSLDEGGALAKLNQIDAVVNRLNGKSVSIKTDPAADTKLQQQINAVTGVGTAAKNAAQSATVFERAWMNASNQTQQSQQKLAALGKNIGTVSTNLTTSVSGMRQYIQGLDGIGKATVKAEGLTNTAGRSFQKYTTTVKNADGSFREYVYSVDTATGATYQLDKGVSSVDKAATHMGDTFGNLITKIAKLAAITTLVYTPVRAFKDAVEELKNVDTELVTVQKVTNATTEEMKGLAAQAYEVAAAYGSTASNYLNSVSAFAKAGYGDLADSLGQLALKTQVVGDVDKETANQFLLSVDAAYQYKGAVSELTAVLDGANELGNKYATDVQKIAEGMGIVSSVAKTAHVEVGQLAAALGTITAVTQRSGSEAARALRALFLNILGNTQITLDEDSDETWTADEIQAMTDALTKFNIATRETVDGVEKLRNPMEVIGDMAMQWKQGLISEVDLNDLVSNLGGKLRSNQLMALIQNYEMYQSMVEDFAGAAGSADKEFGIYLDSWEAKLNKLSAAWTKFVSEFGIEDFIKDLLDLGITLLDLSDNEIVHFVVEVAAMSTAIYGAEKAFLALKGAAGASNFAFLLGEIFTGSKNAAAAVDLLNGALLKSPLFWAVAGSMAIFVLAKYIDANVESLEKFNERIADTNEEIADVQAKIDKLKADGADDSVINAYTRQLEGLNEKLADLNDRKFNFEFSDGGIDTIQYRISNMEKLRDEQRNLNLETEKGRERFEKIDEYLRDTDESLVNYYIHMAEARETGRTFTDSQWELYLQLAELYGTEQDVAEATYLMRIEQAAATEDVNGLVDALDDEAKKSGVAKDELYKLVAQSIIFNNTDLDVSQKIDALQRLAKAAGVTTRLLGATGDQGNARYAQYMEIASAKGMTPEKAEESYWNDLYAEMLWKPPVLDKAARGEDDGSSGKTGGASKVTDKELARLKDVVSLRKSELSLMKERGDSTEDQIAKMRDIQAALHAQAEYLRSIGGNQADINALSTEHWQITNQINDLLAQQAEEQKKAWAELEDYIDDLLDKAKKVRDEKLAAIDDEVAALKKAKEEEDQQLTLEEKRLAVEKARQDLLNAKNERTVRQIQADGQWKWVADAGKVKSAQDALDNARDDLAEYEKELAYNAVLESLEAEKERINKEYEAFEEEWAAIKDSIEEPSRDIADILADINENGAPAMQEAVNSVTEMLDGLAQYIAGVTGGEVGLSGGSEGGSGAGGGFGGSGGSDASYSFGGSYESGKDYLALAKEAAKRGDLDEAQELWNRRGNKVQDQGNDRGTSQEDAWDQIMDAYNSRGGGGNSSGGSSSKTSKKEISQMAAETASKTAASIAAGVIKNLLGKKSKSYDSGGIADGDGFLPKATGRREMVLDPELTAKILEPESNERFQNFVQSMGLLFGTADRQGQSGGLRPAAVSSTDRHDVNYFINGVKVGSDMANRPLSEVLASLPIHTESY